MHGQLDQIHIELTGHFVDAIGIQCVDHDILIDRYSITFLAFSQLYQEVNRGQRNVTFA